MQKYDYKTKKYNSFSTRKKKEFQRVESYQIVKQELTDWQPIVKKNREAVQIDFREDPNKQLANFENKLRSKEFESREFNKEINQNLANAKLLNEAQLGESNGGTNGEGELSKEALSALNKHRHLMLYKEIKAKRLKKIKSKVYRRIKKKQREKEEANILGMKISNDKEALYEEIEKLERRRAEVF